MRWRPLLREATLSIPATLLALATWPLVNAQLPAKTWPVTALAYGLWRALLAAVEHAVRPTKASMQRPVLATTMAPTKDDVLTALKEVYDPEIPINIVDLGLIYRVDFTAPNKVEIDMTLTAIGCPVGPEMIEMVRSTATMVEGIEEADVNLVWRPAWNPTKATDDGKVMLSAMGVRVD